MKKILKIILLTIIALCIYELKTYAAISASSSTVNSGGTVSISITSDVALLSYKVTMTSSGGLTFKNSTGGDGAGTYTITDAKATGMRSLATYTFTAPVVSSDTTYTVTFFASAMDDVNLNTVSDSTANATIKVKGNTTASNSNNTSNDISTSKSVKMIETSPVDFSGFKASNKGPYSVSVENNVTTLTIKVTYTDGSSNTYTRNLEEGSNNITIEGYTIRATRKVAETESVPNVGDEQEENKVENLRLNNIVLDDELNVKLDPNFDPEIFEYTVTLGNDYLDLEELLISAIANLETANITIDGNTNLTNGENLVTITIEAEGYEPVTYTITVIKGEVEDTIVEPEEILEEEPDNSLKNKIIIGSIIALIGLIIIITAIIVNKKKKKNKNTKKKNNKTDDINDFEEDDNTIKDLYNKFNIDEENNIEYNIDDNSDDDEVIGKTEDISEGEQEIDNLDEIGDNNLKNNVDSLFEYEEERPRRRGRYGSGKHSK